LTKEITGISDPTNPRNITKEDSEMILQKLKEQREEQIKQEKRRAIEAERLKKLKEEEENR